jgi:aspartate aminotransferase
MSEMTHEIRMSPIRKMAALIERAAAEHRIISFGGGAPSLAPPKEILDYLGDSLKKNPQRTSAYGSTRGMPHVLELICRMIKDEEGIGIDPDKEIALAEGGTEALFAAFLALLNRGDEMILADPTYVGYYGPLKMLGIKHRGIPVHWQDDFQMTPEMVNDAITRKTKAILLLSPDNPTGRIISDKNLRGIVGLAEEKGIWLITDDIYKDIIYEGKFTNSRKFGGYDNTITCCSFSKSASLPGFRSGYVYGPEKVINKIEIIRSYIDLCAQRPVQYCIEKFLENRARIKKAYIAKTVLPTYRKRRDRMAALLKKHMPEAGISVPKGAFYFFPNVSHYLKQLKMTEEQFCDALFEKKGVVAIPGNYFGEKGRNHIRLTFVSEPEERIEEGFERISEFIRA